MIALFWIIFILIIYTYFGYPLLLGIIANFKKNTISKDNFFPFVSIIIAAHNEEKSIQVKIEDTFNLDYPNDKFEIIVASDGSTDKTNNILEAYGQRIKLLVFNERKGKTFVQNEAVKVAKGEILVFSDATTKYRPDLLKKLVKNFADYNVGVVGGELVYLNSSNSGVGEGQSFYWKYEKLLKRLESKITSLIGVSGCCYAIRKDLYEPLNPDLISDFVIAQMVYKKGKKVIYEFEAISYEESNETSEDEFKMRVRVAVRTLYGLWSMKRLLNPFKYGFYSIQLISHKIFRYLVPIFMFLLFFINIVICLYNREFIYKTILLLQIFFYLVSFFGFFIRGKKNKLYILFYFCITNFALLIGLLNFLKGDKKLLWKPIRK